MANPHFLRKEHERVREFLRCAVLVFPEKGDSVKLYTSGEMAELTCISKRALGIYEKKGLIAPYEVSESSGYHYFNSEQFETIDTIRHLADLGFSLDQIAVFLQAENAGEYQDGLKKMSDQVSREIANLERKRYVLELMLDRSYAYEDSAITVNEAGGEFSSYEYRILTFPIEPAIPLEGTSSEMVTEQWHLFLRNLKRQFIAESVPLEYFSCVSSIISLKDIESGNYQLTGAFVIVDDHYQHPNVSSVTVQRGQYATVYETSSPQDSESAELRGLQALLEYAQSHDYEICGDLLAERVTDAPILASTGNSHLMKISAPIRSRRQGN